MLEPETSRAEIVNLNNPEREMEWKEIYARLNKAIDELPDQCRTVFKLIKEEGFRYKQVAEILGISPRTVETQLFRAIRKLDRVIEMYVENAQQKRRSGDTLSIIFLLLLPFSI
jgi:RNA polymerase sigma-70 factor (ECF subfamily)